MWLIHLIGMESSNLARIVHMHLHFPFHSYIESITITYYLIIKAVRTGIPILWLQTNWFNLESKKIKLWSYFDLTLLPHPSSSSFQHYYNNLLQVIYFVLPIIIAKDWHMNWQSLKSIGLTQYFNFILHSQFM